MSASPFVLPSVRINAPSAAHFAAPDCHNCGAALTTPFCGHCGQERAKRLNVLSIGSEAWQSYRLFEFSVVKAAWRLLLAPGLVAREFVLGRRKQHVHPLKLLLIAIGLLLLVLGQSSMLDSNNANVSKAMLIVRAYANWSFSIGIIAIVFASMAVFVRRHTYNLTEHLVLGVYCHFLIIVLSIVNLLPTLVFRDPHWLALHRSWSGWPLALIETIIVVHAFRQFFGLAWRAQAWQLLAAGLVFAIGKWLLLRLYAMALVKLVLMQMASSS
jgi:hypothetical protein